MRLSNRGFAIAATLTVLALGAYVGYYVVAGAAERGMASRAIAAPFGNPREGAAAIDRYGCHACHEIPGVRGPGGRVGPSLAGLPQRRYLAGELSNTPRNLVTWIMAPQSLRPGSAMPDLGVTLEEAQHIAAYLYAAGERRR